MYRQLYFKERSDKLIHAISAERRALDRTTLYNSPFHSHSAAVFLSNILFSVTHAIIRVFEYILGTKLYVVNDAEDLSILSTQTKRLLANLIKKKIITSWTYLPRAPDQPYAPCSMIQLHPINLPSGRMGTITGSAGTGTDTTFDKAMVRGLAEALERYSLSTWRPESLIHGTFETVRKRGAINPEMFSFFSQKQLSQDTFSKNRVSSTHKFRWKKAYSLTEGKKCLVPAQLVHIFFDKEYNDEPNLWESTTNGAAAGASFEEASYKAICEAIERDSFLIFWLNKLAPPNIDLASISHPKIQNMLSYIQKYDLEFHLLDTTSDLGIPSLCAVLIDYFGEIAVSIDAVADLNILDTVERLCRDSIKLLHLPIRPSLYSATQKKYPHIETIEERRALWANKSMLPHIQFFLKGEKKSFSEVARTAPNHVRNDTSSGLFKLKKILKQHNLSCYIVDTTSPEARKAKLVVVKAILPQLVPLYFREDKKYLGVKRLYTAPIAMGYRERELPEEKLNNIPHPFN